MSSVVIPIHRLRSRRGQSRRARCPRRHQSRPSDQRVIRWSACEPRRSYSPRHAARGPAKAGSLTCSAATCDSGMSAFTLILPRARTRGLAWPMPASSVSVCTTESTSYQGRTPCSEKSGHVGLPESRCARYSQRSAAFAANPHHATRCRLFGGSDEWRHVDVPGAPARTRRTVQPGGSPS